jgi:hypothetical protein
MEKSPYSEANNFSDSQGITLRVLNPNVRLRVNSSPPFVTMLSHINAVHALSEYLFKIHFYILPSMSRSTEGRFTSSFLNKTLYALPIGTSALRLD